MTADEIINRCRLFICKLANQAAVEFRDEFDDWHQDLMLEVIRFATTYDANRGSLTNWIHMRFRRLVALRRNPPAKRDGRCVQFLHDGDGHGHPMAMIDAKAVDPVDEVGRREACAKLKQKLTTLKPRYRAAVTMWYGLAGEKMTLHEIGSELGVSKERARQLIVAGCEDLADVLGDMA